MAKLIVGIDFGTSTTVVRYKLEGADANSIMPLRDPGKTDSHIIPSCIFIPNDSDTHTYGYEALQQKANSNDKGKLITNFKMGLLDGDEQEQEQSKQYIKEFLTFVYQAFANQTLGVDYDGLRVYISHPAKWPSDSVKFMKQAVREAGFIRNEKTDSVESCNEPKAASYEMLKNHLTEWQNSRLLTIDEPINVFMLDMGAGTSDIMIFKLSIDENGNPLISDMLKYPSNDNPILCGGREIDVKLQECVISHCSKYLKDMDESLFGINEAKGWKERISSVLKSGQTVNLPNDISVPLRWFIHDEGKREAIISGFSLSNYDFESLTKDHWKNLYTLINGAITKYQETYGVGAEDIDALFLTGGHARWYTIPNLFNGKGVCGMIGCDYENDKGVVKSLNFEKLRNDPWRMFMNALPHETVARGLCLQGEGIKIVETSANSVWVKLTINDKSTDLIQVVKAGKDIIPLSNGISRKIIMKKNSVFGNLHFDISFDIYIGNCIETAEHKVLKLSNEDDNGVLSRFAYAIFLIPIVASLDYIFEIKAAIDITESSEINISGDLYVDGQKKEHFTNDDLV